MPYSPTSLSTSYSNFILPDFLVSFWCDSARNLLALIDGVFRAQARARGQEQDRWRPNHAENEAFGGMEEENGEEERSRQMRGRHTWDLPRLEQNQLHCFISSYFGDEPSPPVLFHPSTSQTIWRRLIQLMIQAYKRATRNLLTELNNKNYDYWQPTNNADHFWTDFILISRYKIYYKILVELQHDLKTETLQGRNMTLSFCFYWTHKDWAFHFTVYNFKQFKIFHNCENDYIPIHSLFYYYYFF